MRTKKELDVFTCDAPGCPKEFAVDVQLDGMPDGYHGTVTQTGSFGGISAEYFACQATHLRPAILEALERASAPGGADENQR